MKKYGWFILVVTLAALALGRVIWPDAPDTPKLTTFQTVLFAGVALVEALAFGLGLAYFLFSIKKIKTIPKGERTGFLLLVLSIVWLLVSWWPHDNFHRYIGHSVRGLIYIEYFFHVSAVVAALLIARFLLPFLFVHVSKSKM